MLVGFLTKSNGDNQQHKRGFVEIECPGLTDATWVRPRATHSIKSFLEHTCSVYRGNIQHRVCKELFGKDATEKNLSPEDKARLMTTLDARAIWDVKRHGARSAIYSRKCKKQFLIKKNEKIPNCSECESLKGVRSLISALNHEYADDDTLKYTPDQLMETDVHHATFVKFKELRLCKSSLESSQNGDFREFLTHVSILAGKGLFKDCEAVQGLFKSVSVRAEREMAGKSLRGMRVDPYLDDCLTTLGAMSRSALNLFSKNFAGRTARSQRMIEAKSGGKMEPEIHPANFHRIAKNLLALGYSGPIAAASDQTVCVKTLRHHNQSLVGAEGGDKPFKDDEELKRLMKDIVDNDKLCSKVSS